MSNNKNKSTANLTSLLKSTGFFMPTTEKEVAEYDKIFGKTDIILPQEIDNPDWLFKKQEHPDTNSVKKNKVDALVNDTAKIVPIRDTEKSKKDYFKKLILAAEVTNQLHSEPTFGHVKFVKVLYLCEEVCNMRLSTNYVKHAAGPFDPKFMYTAIAEFKKRKWFSVKKRTTGYGFKYEIGKNVEEYKSYYPKYFSSQSNDISRILELLRKQKTDFCEIVATLFFVWKEVLLEKESINDDLLISRFYDWGKEKEKFNIAQLKTAISWMEKEKVVPSL